MSACTSLPAGTVPASRPATTTPTGTVVPVGSASGGLTQTVMQVNIRSGANAGSHYAFSSTPTCTYGVAGEGPDRADSWGSDYQGGGDDLSALVIVVPRGSEAMLGAGSPLFRFSATVAGTTYAIDTLAGGATKGAGHAFVVDFGATVALTIDAATGDGIRIDSTIQCNVVNGPDGRPI